MSIELTSPITGQGVHLPPSWENSPLLAALQRFLAQRTYAKVDCGRPVATDAQWVTATALTQPAIADRPIERIMHKYDATRPVAGTYTFRAALAVPLGLVGYLFAAERRVPLLQENLLYNDDGWPGHIALLEPRAAVLRNDVLAGQPGIETVADEVALVDILFRETASLIEPLIDTWGPRKLLSRGNAWASALDYLAYGFQAAGQSLCTLDAAWADWETWLAQRTWPTRRRPRRYQYAVDEQADEMLVRAGCCLWYTLPPKENAQAHYCTSCYLIKDEQRLAILTEYKRRQAAKAG
ncbi:MAG: (2Fe-2S)-binding protein [Caldilineaceae bacterium]|nr:(2Fe-2S)-binding protein [Caldilineaceae bacterium]